MIDLRRGDCLELMREIPDSSVDLILCDLPYGNIKGLDIWADKETTQWDKRIDTKQLFSEYARILRVKGTAVLFSMEKYTSHLRTYKQANFKFKHPLIWRKDSFANFLNVNNAPASYYEDISVFGKDYDDTASNPLRDYFSDVMDFLGVSSCTQVNKLLGHSRAEHTFRVKTLQFDLCTEATYNELVERLHIDKMEGFRPYDELTKINTEFKTAYRNAYNRTFNVPDGGTHVPNVLEYKKESERFHPTQKPVELLEYLIKVYTNEGDTVLDNCMGSGSTGVACVNTGRNFIGYELDERYYNIACERIRKIMTSDQ